MAKLKRPVALGMASIMLVTNLANPGLASAQQFDALWMKRSVSDHVQLVVPSAQWRLMMRVKKSQVDQLSSYEYRAGERWMTLQREEVATIPGLTSDKISSVMRLPRRDATMVFARYVPQQAQLVIDAIKVEEERGGWMAVYHTYFSPYHGEHWAFSRAFLTDAEARADLNRAGRNPFEAFKPSDRTDPTFVNIGWDGAMVAVGLAMKYFHTAYSVMSVQNLRMAQSVTSHGSFLHKTTTIKVDGYADPVWFIGLPSTMQSWGTTAAICVVPAATQTDPNTGRLTGTGCPDPKLVATAGVSFDQWTGGTMPMAEEHIFHWEKSQSGFTVAFFTLAVMAAAFFVGPELYAAATNAGAGLTEVGAISGTQAALAAGGAYAGGSLLLTSGPTSISDVQSGVFGSIGDGTRAVTDPGSQQVRDATAILVQRHLDTSFDPNGSCSDQGTLCSTQAGMANITPDPSKVVFRGDQEALRARARYCSQVLHQKDGDAFNACVASRTAPIDVP